MPSEVILCSTRVESFSSLAAFFRFSLSIQKRLLLREYTPIVPSGEMLAQRGSSSSSLSYSLSLPVIRSYSKWWTFFFIFGLPPVSFAALVSFELPEPFFTPEVSGTSRVLVISKRK